MADDPVKPEAPEYYNALPEPVRKFAQTDSGEIKPLEQFVSDIENDRQWRGNSLRIPGPDATPEALSDFQKKAMEKIPGLARLPNKEDAASMQEHYRALGAPETAEGYKMPDAIEMSDEQVAQLKVLAHQSNLTQGQFAEYVKGLTSVGKSALEAAQLAHEQNLAVLKQEWGAAYEGNVAEIAAMLKTNKLTPPHVLEQLKQGNLPADQVRWLHSLADAIDQEGSEFYQQDVLKPAPMLSPTEANLRIEELNTKLFDRANPPNAQERQILQKRAEALTYMAKGKRPPDELLQYVA